MIRNSQIAVIGSGAAGIMAAIAAAEHTHCLLITDGAPGQSNSVMAQGGLQVPWPTAASLQSFYADIVRSARVALDPDLVRNFVAQVTPTVELLQDWGLELDRHDDGTWVRRTAGGLSEARIVSARDQIGPALMKVLLARLQSSAAEILPATRVEAVQPHDRGWLLTLRAEHGEVYEMHVPAVICCTGGTAYRESQRRAHSTTNPANHNHLLFDRLAELGLPQVHPDFFQYQPFGIVDSDRDDVGRCVPESIVNFGVRLLDRHGAPVGDVLEDRFALTQRMFEVVAAGDGVASACGRHGLWLTLSDVDPATIARIFPKLQRFLERTNQVGRNVLVYPFLHYFLGGFRVTPRCEAALPGLFLAGEMTGGLHGRNRLMGNGITDSLVHGRIAGRSAAAYVHGRSGRAQVVPA